ncbi:MAG TPA: hypothetical protein VHD84_00250 [Candidatus Saccharimonadales bacterium]|nr:hypothetical protein [Candidatus Saccharimonadales bacterium]
MRSNEINIDEMMREMDPEERKRKLIGDGGPAQVDLGGVTGAFYAGPQAEPLLDPFSPEQQQRDTLQQLKQLAEEIIEQSSVLRLQR